MKDFKDMLKGMLMVFLAMCIVPLSAFVFVDHNSEKLFVKNIQNSKLVGLSERQYVIGALCCEMPPSFHLEALKAQAAAIYTNAVRSKALNEDYVCEADVEGMKGYTTEKVLKDKWGKNFDVYYKKMCDAADSVLGNVITYNGNPVVAAYHSMSAGKTEGSENVWGEKVNYLTPVLSEGDTFCAEFKSEKVISVEKVREILKKEYPDTYLPEVDTLLFTDIKTSPSKTVLSLLLGDKEISGQKIRELFSLRSAAFEIEIKEGNVHFTTYGYGHGVGLSQYGADFMARQGSSFEDIIKHYYVGTEIMYKNN